ncbi:MAG: hypothetical protein M3526_03820 [Actinomycetota bacterium]|nr:hypothetical protein [Actinomycetota bacterium]
MGEVYARCIDALVTNRTLREIRRHALIYAGLTPFVVIAVFPVLWMAITAFKEDADLYRTDHVPFCFYLPPTLKHFRLLSPPHTSAPGWSTFSCSRFVWC